MRADNAAVGGDDFPRGAFPLLPLPHELVVLAGGDEADFLAVLLVRYTQANLCRQLANLRLKKAADGKEHSGKELPPDPEKYVRLDLPIVDAAEQSRWGVLFVSRNEPGVVPGGDELGSHAVGVIEQLAELEPVVALHAGVRRPPAGVLVHEIVDDLLELRLQVQGVERNIQLIGHAAGILRITGTATTLLVIRPRIENRERQPR